MVLKRLCAWLVSTALLLWTGVSAALDFVGRSTVTDDAALLVERIFSAPLWAQIVVTVFALAWMVWVLSPDFRQANEIKKLRKEAKDSQDRAWSFSAQHQELLEEAMALRSDVAALNDRLDSQGEENIKAATEVAESIRSDLTYATSGAFRQELMASLHAELQKALEQQATANARIDGIESLVDRFNDHIERLESIASRVGDLESIVVSLERRLPPES